MSEPIWSLDRIVIHKPEERFVFVGAETSEAAQPCWIRDLPISLMESHSEAEGKPAAKCLENFSCQSSLLFASLSLLLLDDTQQTLS